MNAWVLAGTTFLASLVEFVEAATIVMAVGYAQSWRSALGATAAATAALGILVALFGSIVANETALQHVELIVGPFLILFGMSWLRKAVWRYAGRKAMRDEQAAFDRECAQLRARDRRNGFAVAFQGVFVEGLEVVVIVVTFGASSPNAIVWGAGGSVAALVVVTLAAIALRKPFARVPENAMKALVGVMLAALGTFWTGEGLGVQWWLGDGSLFAIAAAYALVATASTVAMRTRAARA